MNQPPLNVVGYRDKWQILPRISTFRSEAPRAAAPAVPGAAKLTVPPAGMGAAVVRRDSIGFEVRFYFRAHICTHMSRFVHLLHNTAPERWSGRP